MASRSSIRIPRPRNRLDIDEAKRLRNQDGLSGTAIARKLGVTREHLWRALKDRGVSLRPARTMDEPHAERLRSLWHSVRARCSTPNDRLYARYGAKGFAVSAEWEDFWRFYDWAISAGYRPLLHPCHVSNIKGRSYRLREHEPQMKG